ncbi:16299_t:CDS:2 [Entrophospora sp. SA101]|nr:16299_t:CDS:2 [Entrophospora sp. SA101]
MGKRCEPPSSDKITQIRDSDEKYKQIDTYAQTRPRSGSSHILKEINVINGEPPLSNTYSGINKRPRSSPLHLSPLEEVQNQIVGLKNSQSHSILDYQNNGIIDDNIYSSNINIITNNNLINQNQNNFISTGDINNNINVSNNDYNNNPQPQHTQLDNNTAENNRLKLSNSPVSPLSKSTDQQSLIPSKKPKPYKVKSGAFIMCLEIFILGVIILVSWKITDLTDGNTALFNITTGIGTIPIIHNKTTTNT